MSKSQLVILGSLELMENKRHLHKNEPPLPKVCIGRVYPQPNCFSCIQTLTHPGDCLPLSVRNREKLQGRFYLREIFMFLKSVIFCCCICHAKFFSLVDQPDLIPLNNLASAVPILESPFLKHKAPSHKGDRCGKDSLLAAKEHLQRASTSQ